MQASPHVLEIGKAFTPGAPCAAPLDSDDGLQAFLNARPRLFGIAYRMLGNAAEADDVVQDVWIRWQTTDRRPVCSPLAFLVTATTRLAINVLQSARARRETGAVASLPEPADPSVDPGVRAERGEALNLAVVRLLERLSPTERAAFVLREAFNYAYRQIAAVLRVEEANARQLVTRARTHLMSRRNAPVSPTQHRLLLDTLVAAARTGDLRTLESLFTVEAGSTADGNRLLNAAAAGRRSREHNDVDRRNRWTRAAA